MIQHQGVYLPDNEAHFIAYMNQLEFRDHLGRGTYQANKQAEAAKLTTRRGVAVDVGAHCGLWAMQLEIAFDVVHAFEPIKEHIECLEANTSRTTIHPFALGAKKGRIGMVPTDTNTGMAHVDESGADFEVLAFDDLGITGVDFVKLDCEGYELPALMGMSDTLDRDKPAVVVEQKPGHAQRYGYHEIGAVTYLLGKGYNLVAEMACDYFLRHKDVR